MRFILAALAALLVLMPDFDCSPGPTASDAPAVPGVRVSQGDDAVPFAARFMEGVSAEPGAMVENEIASSEDEGDDAAAAPAAPAIDAFCHTLKEAAETNEIPVPFFARLIWQESRFRSNEISHAGAQGVAQFMPGTAAEVGLVDPFDPLQALPASARLLRKLRDDFGNLGLAAAAYNAGSGRIQKWLTRRSELPRETRDYVRIITGTRAEDWIEDAEMLAIRSDLPRGAPCEGVGGLSASNDITIVPASAAPGVMTMIRKADAIQRTARVSAGHGRRRLALLLKSTPGTARALKLRHVMVAHARARPAKSRAVHLALRERISS